MCAPKDHMTIFIVDRPEEHNSDAYFDEKDKISMSPLLLNC